MMEEIVLSKTEVQEFVRVLFAYCILSGILGAVSYACFIKMAEYGELIALKIVKKIKNRKRKEVVKEVL